MTKQKLELTWIGKEKRPNLESRILLEDPAKSYHAAHSVSENVLFDNRHIKEVRRTAATSPTLEEKLAHQKRQRELEAKRTKLRRELFARQDAIEAQRNDIISQLENQLQQQVQEQTLFTVEWELR